jgi:transposase
LATDGPLETLIAALENAFLAFRVVPREVLYDNVRTVVVQRNAYGRGRHRFLAGFLNFARYSGFRPRLCQLSRASMKGKVERFIRSLRGGFHVQLTNRLGQEGLVFDG